MHLSINIDEAMNFDGGDSSGNFFGSTVNTYFDKEYSYEQVWTSGYGNTGGVWQKSKLPEGTWSSGNQLSPLLELLKSANQPMLLRSDTINGQPCLVMNITPSVEAIANWVISQNPGSTISSGPSLSGKDMLIKTFKGGIFQLWITADTHLIMRADFAPHFAVTGDELRQSWGDGLPSASNITGITSDFLGQLVFSNYNQPVSIEVPAEALNAKAR